MKDNVVWLQQDTRLDIPADRVLENAPEKMDSVVIVGFDEEGDFYFASSLASGPEVNWLLDMAKAKLLEIGKGE